MELGEPPDIPLEQALSNIPAVGQALHLEAHGLKQFSIVLSLQFSERFFPIYVTQ